jgi:hypothetical protein
MSSTNRSRVRDNHISDYYVTPQKPIRDLLDAIKKEGLDIMGRILDPCAGGDDINDMSYPKAIGVEMTTMDIRDTSRASIKGDFINYDFGGDKFDVVITNPPFNIAEDIIRKAMLVTKDGGYVIMLLRLNFFGSKKRKAFWEDNMPMLTFVHRERISFTGGQTDSIEYMHCVWQVGTKNNYTKLFII